MKVHFNQTHCVPDGTINYGNIWFLPIFNPDGIIFRKNIFYQILANKMYIFANINLIFGYEESTFVVEN